MGKRKFYSPNATNKFGKEMPKPKPKPKPPESDAGAVAKRIARKWLSVDEDRAALAIAYAALEFYGGARELAVPQCVRLLDELVPKAAVDVAAEMNDTLRSWMYNIREELGVDS